MNINVGCFKGRRIEQFNPVLITVYPYNFGDDADQSFFYYDFGDGSSIITNSSVSHHVYQSSGDFVLRVVKTDNPLSNVSTDGSIDCYSQKIIYVFPIDSPYMFQLLSEAEMNENSGNFNNISLSMHVIEIPLGKSKWFLRMIETTNTYYGNFIENFNVNLGRFNYSPSIITENEDLLHSIKYNAKYKCYEIEFNYIGYGMQSFTIKFDFDISIGSLLPITAEYIASTEILKFGTKSDDDYFSIKKVMPIPYLPAGAVAMNELNHPIITNDNFYDWTEMNESVDDICISSSRVYFLKNGSLYYSELNSNEVIDSIPYDNKVNVTTIGENDSYRLFGSPRSSFRKSDDINAPNQILLFINSSLYRIDESEETQQEPIEIENMTKVLFATAYLDSNVTVVVYENDEGQFYRIKIDSIENKNDIQKIAVENLSIVFMHDLTKKMIFINDSFIFLSSDLGISLKIVFIFQPDERVLSFASSLGMDEVIVYTNAGRAIIISPELSISTTLFNLRTLNSSDVPVFIYNYDDSLQFNLNNLTIRIPTESLIRALTYSLPGGSSSRLWLEKDYGNILQFAILKSKNSESSYLLKDKSADNEGDTKNLHYYPGYVPYDWSMYDLSHLSLFGLTEECKFISGSPRCEVLAFDEIIKEVIVSGTAWLISSDSHKVGFYLNLSYFDQRMIGVTVSVPTIKLIFIIEKVVSDREVTGFVSLEPDNFDKTSRDSPRQFDFCRFIDLREYREYESDGGFIKVADTTEGGQKIILEDSSIRLDSSMVGMSLVLQDNVENSFYPILKVEDYDIMYVIKKKGGQRPLKERKFEKWKITWDPSANIDPLLERSWSLRYSWCSPICDPSFYYPIYSIRSMDYCRYDLNLSSESLLNTRIVSNEQFETVSTVSPNNLSLAFDAPRKNYSLSSFLISIRDSSPQCKHTYLLGISKICSDNIRFLLNFDNLQLIPIPKYNYRAPSDYGMMIGTSPYIYNVNPNINDYNYKNKSKISQNNFNPGPCSSSSKDINDMSESATNCITSAYQVRYGTPIAVKFTLQEYRIIDWENTENNYKIHIKEINGRTDLCINGKCKLNEREMNFDDEFIVSGKELYHFKFTVNVTGCLYVKYAVFWCSQEMLPKSYVYLTMTIVMFLLVCVFELIYFNVIYKSVHTNYSNSKSKSD